MTNRDTQPTLESKDLIPIRQAAAFSPYSAEYLSLLARKGRLRAVKISRDWLTTRRIVREYVREQQIKHQKFKMKESQ